MKKLIILIIFTVNYMVGAMSEGMQSSVSYKVIFVEPHSVAYFNKMVKDMSPRNKPVLEELLSSEVSIRRQALQKLEDGGYCTGPDNLVFREQLFRMSLSASPRIRSYALRLLGKHFLFSDQTSWSLVKALEHSVSLPASKVRNSLSDVNTFDTELRLTAIGVLEKQILATSSDIFYHWWAGLLSHPVDFVRQSTINSFKKRSRLSDFVVKKIGDMAVNDPNKSVRLVAISFLEKSPISNVDLLDSQLAVVLRRLKDFDVLKKVLTIFEKRPPRSLEVQKVISDTMWHSSKTIAQSAFFALQRNPHLYSYVREEIRRKKAGQLMPTDQLLSADQSLPTEMMNCATAWN